MCRPILTSYMPAWAGRSKVRKGAAVLGSVSDESGKTVATSAVCKEEDVKCGGVLWSSDTFSSTVEDVSLSKVSCTPDRRRSDSCSSLEHNSRSVEAVEKVAESDGAGRSFGEGEGLEATQVERCAVMRSEAAGLESTMCWMRSGTISSPNSCDSKFDGLDECTTEASISPRCRSLPPETDSLGRKSVRQSPSKHSREEGLVSDESITRGGNIARGENIARGDNVASSGVNWANSTNCDAELLGNFHKLTSSSLNERLTQLNRASFSGDQVKEFVTSLKSDMNLQQWLHLLSILFCRYTRRTKRSFGFQSDMVWTYVDQLPADCRETIRDSLGILLEGISIPSTYTPATHNTSFPTQNPPSTEYGVFLSADDTPDTFFSTDEFLSDVGTCLSDLLRSAAPVEIYLLILLLQGLELVKIVESLLPLTCIHLLDAREICGSSVGSDGCSVEYVELILDVLECVIEDVDVCRYLVLFDIVYAAVPNLPLPLLVVYTDLCVRGDVLSYLDPKVIGVCTREISRAAPIGAEILIPLSISLCESSESSVLFFSVALPRLCSIVESWEEAPSFRDCMCLLKVCREFKTTPSGVDLQERLCEKMLILAKSKLSLEYVCESLEYLTFDKQCESRFGRMYVHAIMHSLNAQPLATLGQISALNISRALDCFASWGFRTVLYNKFGDCLHAQFEVLCHNLGVFLTCLNAFARASWYHTAFMNTVCRVCRVPGISESLTLHQCSRLVGCLARLHHYEFDIYQALVERITIHFSHFLYVRDLSPVVWAFSSSNHIYKPFFDEAYHTVMALIQAESLDATRPATANSLISLCWSFMVAGYHGREDFPVILDYAFFSRRPDDRMGYKRLHQIADACILEYPHIAHNCQYFDTMLWFCSHESCRTYRACSVNLRHDKDAEMLRNRTIAEVSCLLTRLSVPHRLNYEPDYYSPYLVDICLDSEKKIGLFIQGRDKSLRHGFSGKWSYSDTGIAALQRRILKKRNWTLSCINLAFYLHLPHDAKQTHLLNKLQECHSQYQIHTLGLTSPSLTKTGEIANFEPNYPPDHNFTNNSTGLTNISDGIITSTGGINLRQGINYPATTNHSAIHYYAGGINYTTGITNYPPVLSYGNNHPQTTLCLCCSMPPLIAPPTQLTSSPNPRTQNLARPQNLSRPQNLVSK